jgi:glycosyltransferase involved in cell wall biosynthesis
MRVLHVIPRFIGGGPERHLLALAAEWKKAGFTTEHKVAVLETPISAALFLRARKLGMQILGKPSIADLQAAIANADIVEVTTWNHPLLLDTLRHDWPAARVIVQSAVVGTTAPQILFEELGRFADTFLITSSLSLQTSALRLARLRGASIMFVPALADMSRLQDFSPRAHEGINVGYLGLIEPTKMHPRFAELSAAVRSHDVRFDLFGDGTWAPDLARRFEELGAGHRVRFHGHAEDLRAAFAELDVFGYPLAADSYATSEKALQEAMWAGIPPVVLAGNGASGLVEHEHTGLVCNSDNDYPRAIDLLANDASLRRRLGAAAQVYARQHFDPSSNALRLRKLFELTAALPPRAREPLPGRGAPAAARFVQSLGNLARPFKTSLDGTPRYSLFEIGAAEAAIAASSAVLARGEGGVIHYRNAFPDDPHLRLWTGLIARNAGDSDTAAAEFNAALGLGLHPQIR